MNPRTVVDLPFRLESEANVPGSWHARAGRAKSQREGTFLLLRAAEKPRLPLVVRITRVAPRELDDDNLARAAKAVRDGVADWLGIRDNDPRISWLYGQRREGKRHYGVTVELFHPAVAETRIVAVEPA